MADRQPCQIIAFPSRSAPALKAIDPAPRRAQWQAAFVAMAVAEAFTIAEDDDHLDRAVLDLLETNRASAMRVLREIPPPFDFSPRRNRTLSRYTSASSHRSNGCFVMAMMPHKPCEVAQRRSFHVASCSKSVASTSQEPEGSGGNWQDWKGADKHPFRDPSASPKMA